MNHAPRIQGRHALRWVLGVGLVFVVVVAMALQVARRRADERWDRIIQHRDESVKHGAQWGRVLKDFRWGTPLSEYGGDTMTRGGNVFLAWKQSRWECPWFILVLRQERNFFGSNTEARVLGGAGMMPGKGRIMVRGEAPGHRPALNDVIRTLFAEVDVELVVEP